MSPKKLAMTITSLRGKMTQEELAKRAKLSRGYLAAIEAGHKKNPSLAVLRRLAKALGVPVTELLGG
jgi:transcriptional regulator with XRE-family HTH domain